MSRLSDLLRQVNGLNPQLGADLDREVRALSGRRAFGLNFERHRPEAFELPLRPIRRGDKVRILPPRGSTTPGDKALWSVTATHRVDGTPAATLEPMANLGDPLVPDVPSPTVRVPVTDLVAVAEYRDVIHPGLVSTGRVERGGDAPFHSVINAENSHALKTLTYTHRGKVDCIYIDPPYNTGARDWKYNNDYVADDDHYRHSKWLAFMERRLLLAKELLNPIESALIIAIDENEVHRLSLLVEQTFTGSKLQTVTVLINPAGASIIDQFSRVDEHLLFVHVGTARPRRTLITTTPGVSNFVTETGAAKPFQWEPFQRSGGNSRRQDTKAKFFPVWIHQSTETIVGCGDHLPEGTHRSQAAPPPEGCVAQWPIKQDGTEACWQLSAPTFRQYLADGRIKIGTRTKTTGRWGIGFVGKGVMAAIAAGELVVDGRDAKGALVVANAAGRVRSQVGKTIWTNGAYSATEHGSTLLKNFIPRKSFPFPKSLYAVEDALRFYVGHKPDAVVLDFFGGSGTTAHAVMRLNKQDGGRRVFILVTNNEVSADEQEALRQKGLRPGDAEWEALGICEHITKPRIAAAVTGRTQDGSPVTGDYRFIDPFPMADGLAANVEFFDLTYESPVAVRHNLAFARIAALLWLRAGSTGRRIDTLPEAGWDVTDAYGLLVDLDRAEEFTAAVAAVAAVRVVFVVTDDDSRFQAVARQLPRSVQPVRLWESYLSNFEFVNGD